MEFDELLKRRKSVAPEQMAHLRKVLSDTLILHRNMSHAMEELSEIIQLGKPGQLVVLCGPTNGGKTKLVKTMDQMLVADARAKGLPVWGSTYCRLPSPVRARFDHGETYRRTLCSLEEPLVDSKVEYPSLREGALPRRSMPQAKRGPTHAALWQALTNRIQAGHLAVFFDEAGELPQSLKVTTLRESVNLFKQLADVGGSNVILVSGPEFGPVLWESGQLAARLRLVPLDAYNFRNAADVKVFGKVLEKIETSLGHDYVEEGILAANAKEVMQKVRGTIGIALDIVVHAAHEALCAGEARLVWGRLNKAIDRRMKEIGSQVDREQALWAAVKDESLRSKHWGIEAAAGYLGKGMILPTHPPTEVAAAGRKSDGSESSDSTIPAAASKAKTKGKGMHPTVPENVVLDEYSRETDEEEA